MEHRWQRLMIAHGAMVFLLGLVAGFGFLFFILEEVAIWPIPWRIDFQFPGTVRGWRMAHMEGLLNGLACIGVAGIFHFLTLTERTQKWIAYCMVTTAWCNTIAALIGPLFSNGDSVPRGLDFGKGFASNVMFVLFFIAIVTVIVALILIARGALARPKEEDSPS